MKVFISWSGELSGKIAKLLNYWLPDIIQGITPYMSGVALDKGDRWLNDISGQLDEASCGLICLTKENLSAPWINFEAGALGKSIDNSRVCPLLFDLAVSDVNYSLKMFQVTRATDKEDFYQLMCSINKSQTTPLKESTLQKAFNHNWDEFALPVQDILKNNESHNANSVAISRPPVTVDEKTLAILEELLALSRNNYRLLRNPEHFLPREYRKSATRAGVPDSKLAMQRVIQYLVKVSEELHEMAVHDQSLAELAAALDVSFNTLVRECYIPLFD